MFFSLHLKVVTEVYYQGWQVSIVYSNYHGNYPNNYYQYGKNINKRPMGLGALLNNQLCHGPKFQK